MNMENEIGKLSETAKLFNEKTLGVLLPFWASNIANNMPAILNGKNVDDIPKRKDEPAIVIAAGPSLKKKKHLNLLKSVAWKHPIITCDRMLTSCLAKKIIPYCVCTVDASPKVSKFYENELVAKHNEAYTVLSVASHPRTVTYAKYNREIYWFIPFMDDAKNDPTSLTRMLHFMTNKSMILVGGNVGSLSWNIAHYLKCNPIILIGFDLSYDDANITKSIYYQAFLQLLKGDKKETKSLYAMSKHPVFKNKYVLDPIFKSYREMFRNYASTAHRLYGLETINATEGGSVFGDGITCIPFKQALRDYE
jgi:hypothetical protein